MNRHMLFTAALLLGATVVAGCATTPHEPGFTVLLDGSKPETLKNWDRVGVDVWKVVDGAVVATKRDIPDPRNSDFLMTKQSYKNFKIHTVFWVDYACNSGVYIRVQDPKKPIGTGGYEVNIWDSRPDPSYGTGAIVGVGKVDPMPKAAGKWTTFDITAEGTHMVVYMDGKKTVDANDSRYAEGQIGLQYGGGELKWRTFQIKPL